MAADLPAGWQDDVTTLCDPIPPRLDEYDDLLTGQPIFRERTEGVGVITAEQAIAMSATGPLLRSAGVAWDLRRAMPYLRYDQVDFDVVVGTYGDAFDRYAMRLNEMRESIQIVRQIVDLMPAGDYRIQDKKVTPPPRPASTSRWRRSSTTSSSSPRASRCPKARSTSPSSRLRGELGCYLVSDGSAKPYRLHIRGPSFVNLQSLPLLMRGGLVADAVAVISSIDPVMGEVDR